MAYRDGPSGIGGWLAFYLVTLGVISPLVMVVSLYANLYADPSIASFYGDSWLALQAIELGINFLLLAAMLYAAWRFFRRRNWHTVRIAIAVMWIAAVPAGLLEFAAVSFLGDIDAASLASVVIADLVKPVIYSTIWTAYLLRSVRVANTYPRDPDVDSLAEVFE